MIHEAHEGTLRFRFFDFVVCVFFVENLCSLRKNFTGKILKGDFARSECAPPVDGFIIDGGH